LFFLSSFWVLFPSSIQGVTQRYYTLHLLERIFKIFNAIASQVVPKTPRSFYKPEFYSVINFGFELGGNTLVLAKLTCGG
jgi:hypothetical protein